MPQNPGEHVSLLSGILFRKMYTTTRTRVTLHTHTHIHIRIRGTSARGPPPLAAPGPRDPRTTSRISGVALVTKVRSARRYYVGPVRLEVRSRQRHAHPPPDPLSIPTVR